MGCSQSPSISRSAQRFRATSIAAALLIPFILSSCLAPSPLPEKRRAEPSVEFPWESMSASIALGDPSTALEKFEKALADSPQSPATRILHGRLLMIAGKLAEAREELGLVLGEDPRSTDALYNLSLVAGLEGRAEEQEELLGRVVAIDAGHSDALAALGDLALARGDEARGAEWFQKALAGDPGNFLALLGQGTISRQRGDCSGAVDLFTRAIARQPDFPFSYIERARAQKSLGLTGEALGDLSRAIALDPGYSWSYLDRGKLYVMEARREEALADFSMAIRLSPEQFSGYALRASVLDAKGDREGALADWERVLALKPGYWFAYPPLGALYFEKGEWDKARQAFLSAYRYQEDDHSLALLAALCSHRGGNPRDSSQALQTVLSQVERDSWYAEIARFLIDPAADARLLNRLQGEKNKALKARMLFYVAEQYLASGRRRAAVSYLALIDGEGDRGLVETRLARFELARSGGGEQE